MVRTTLTHLLHHLGLLSDGLIRDEGCSNLLCDTPGLSVLHVCSANLVQNFSLAGVYMPQDAHHRGTEEVRRAFFFVSLTPVLRVEAASITACHSIHHTLTLVHHRWKTLHSLSTDFHKGRGWFLISEETSDLNPLFGSLIRGQVFCFRLLTLLLFATLAATLSLIRC